MVAGIYSEEDLGSQRWKDVNNRNFLDAKIVIRLFEEHYERIRRQKVIAGEWSEEESNHKIASLIEKEENEKLGPVEWKKYKRDFSRFMIELDYAQNPDSLLEREYHFDEGSGVSLDKHVEDLKAQYPQANIETRRDRDGFGIVKISHKREYKYDLDKILSFDKEKEMQKLLEFIEEVA